MKLSHNDKMTHITRKLFARVVDGSVFYDFYNVKNALDIAHIYQT